MGEMIEPPLVMFEEVRNSSSTQMCGDEGANMICSNALAKKTPPMISQIFSMQSDKTLEKRQSPEPESTTHTGHTLPMVQSQNSVAVDTKMTSPNNINHNLVPNSVGSLDTMHSHHKPGNEAGGLVLHKSQGRPVTAKNKNISANTISGRWTAAEHEAFLQGLKVYGREWKKVATCIPTRTSAQIRSHAQKYFAKVNKEQEQLIALAEKRRMSFPDAMPSSQQDESLNDDPKMSQSFVNTMDSIMKDPSEVETKVCKTLASLRERYKCLEDRLQQIKSKASALPEGASSSSEVVLGPASAALAKEQKDLRQAAVARYEMKRLENQNKKEPESKPPLTSIATPANSPSCARVSLASIPSHGGFDSSDVLALSMLGGNLGREKIENQTRSTIKDVNSLKMVRERLQGIKQEGRPTKLRKIDEH